MSTIDRRVFDFRPGSSDADPARVDLLGGKGASLAAMSRAGFPVPPGFTIAADCCVWAQQYSTWPNGLRDEVRRAMQRLEQASGRTFGRGPRHLLVAVRSGAAVSMPGMMDTILNCGLHPGLIECYPNADAFWREYAEFVRMFGQSAAGMTMVDDPASDAESLARRRLAQWRETQCRPFPEDPWELLDLAIDAVFASWNSERARTYRRRHDLQRVAGTAVNVQAMFPSARSGVLFTAHPHDPARREMLLEASWGLGEAVVSGAVTPDIYALDTQTLDVKETTAGTRPGAEPALSAEQIRELGQLGRQVEEYFRAPSDIEWGWSDGRFVLLQARPIRGLDILAEVPQARADEIARLRSAANGRRAVWVEHNLAETLRYPTPLTWDVVRWFMSGRGGFGQLYRLLGFHPSAQVDDEGFLELICGRIYGDPRRAAQLFFGSFPFAYDVQEVLADRRVIEAPPRRLNLDEADPFLFARLPLLAWRLWSASHRAKRLRRELPQRFDEFVRTQLHDYLSATANESLTQFDDDALVDEFLRRRDWVLGPLAAESLLPGYFGGMALAQLTHWTTQLLGEREGEQLAAELTSGLDGDITVEQNIALDAVAGGARSLEQFLAEFGHRAASEMELAEPRWSEDPTPLEQLLSRQRTAATLRPAERHAAQVARRKEAEDRLPVTLASAGGASLRERIAPVLAEARLLLPYRETGKFHLMRGYATLRAPLVELARRWQLGRDLFFLQVEELKGYTQRASELRDEIVRRKRRWQAFQRLPATPLIDSEALDQLGDSPPVVVRTSSDAPSVWPARPLSSGVAAGRAAIVQHPSEVGVLPDDFVLVCPSTDPGWTPLLVGARALIVERGGVLSHGAIVARDFGIPAVMLEQATTLIPAGARVEVDARQGQVRVVQEAPAS